jgi:ABC-type nitrate/sulfonate/bicarbonate transport system permease component
MTIGTIRMDTTGTSRGRVLAALAAMHVGYGLGMWQGLARLARSTVSRSMRVYRPRSDGH